MRRPKSTSQPRQCRAAFTLVEMLVAVALVMIMMTMFAQIFALASGILSQQRGVALNDLSERQIRTVFRDDINRRTFRDVIPFPTATGTVANDPEREGYFHIGEGSTADDGDDVLQFTIFKEADEDPFYGRATKLTGMAGTDVITDLQNSPNQPEFDDEDLTTPFNRVGASRYAEVVYFLRPNGNLYRRVMLVRDPKVPSVSPPADPQSPPSGTGGNIISGPYGGDFWNDFDYSTYYDGVAGYVKFLGTETRQNNLPTFPGVTPVSLGVPRYRWGFNPTSGQPRQAITDTSAVQHFIGRFTQQETSDPDFDYPGLVPATDWLDPAVQLPYNATTGVITTLADGTRVGEDIVLKNVHSFDIKAWDPAASPGPDGVAGFPGDDDGDGVNDNPEELGWPDSDDGAWRDLGHSDATGMYRLAASGGASNFGNNNVTFGEYPSGGANGNCYDTWHPADVGMPGNVAPYRPVLISNGSDGQPGNAGVDDDGVNGVDDPGERGWANTDDLDPRPLGLIRIHLRYVDQKSDQMRDVIIVHSLTE